VIFHCSSSNGRGPRCAGWYADYLVAHSLTEHSEALVLKGGIKAWLDSEHGRAVGGVKDVLGDYREAKI
jgi:arsenical-resistance protein 2